MTQRTNRSLDHFVINVRDIEVSGEGYRRLGFRVMPTMEHREIGTSNTVIQFHDTYFELIGEFDHSRVGHFEDQVRPWTDQGDIYWMTSMTSAKLEDEKPVLAAQGIEMAPILNAARRVRKPSGGWDTTDSRSSYLWNADDVFASLFLSDHRKPEAIWIDDYLVHPNTAIRVGGIRYLMSDPTRHAEFFGKVAGGSPVSQSAETIRFETQRGEFIELLTPAAFQARFPEGPSLTPGTHTRGGAFTIIVESLDRCRWSLRDGGVPHRVADGAIIVGSAHGSGMAFEFVEQVQS